jgi:hypothetical protein
MPMGVFVANVAHVCTRATPSDPIVTEAVSQMSLMYACEESKIAQRV